MEQINSVDKLLKIWTLDGELVHSEPVDFISKDDIFNHNELSIEGDGLVSAIGKIFPVAKLAVGGVKKIFGKKKTPGVPVQEVMEQTEEVENGTGFFGQDDPNVTGDGINGGFLSAVLPLVMKTLPGVLSGFKELFTGQGIVKHTDDLHGLTHAGVHYINPIKFNAEMLKRIHGHYPFLPKYKYKVQLVKGNGIEYEDILEVPLNKDEVHILGHGIGIGIDKPHATGIGFNTKEYYNKRYKNVAQLL
jgi:hypothetical protein